MYTPTKVNTTTMKLWVRNLTLLGVPPLAATRRFMDDVVVITMVVVWLASLGRFFFCSMVVSQEIEVVIVVMNDE
jgi:hypothetical protein